MLTKDTGLTITDVTMGLTQGAGLSYTKFNPSFLPGLNFWVDASDESTVTIDTGVSNWADKSGEGHDLTQPTAAQQPGYTAGVSVDFIGEKIMTLGGVLGTTYDIYAVVTSLSSNATWRTLYYNGLAFPNNEHILLLETGSNRMGVYDTTFQNSGLTWPVSTKKLVAVRSAGTSISQALNGGDFVLVDGSVSNTAIDDVGNVGVAPHVQPFGNVHEIVAYSSPLSTLARAQIEAYLMAKWGVV